MQRIATVAAVIARKRFHNKANHQPENGDEDSMAQGSQSATRPLLRQLSVPSSDASLGSTSYGAVDRTTSSPETYRRNSVLGRVPEETADPEADIAVEMDEREVVEAQLADQGLYIGSYEKIVVQYTFVPISSFILLVVLAILPPIIWKVPYSRPLPHSPYFPFPLPEVLLSSALWSLSHIIRLPMYTVFSSILNRSSQPFVTVVFHIFYAVMYNLLRLSALPILRIKHQMDYTHPTWRDLAFRRVWWLALGWAAIEVVMGVAQDYAKIALYEKVLVPEDKISEVMDDPNILGAAGIRREFSAGHDDIQLSPRIDPPGPMGLSRIESINSLTAQHTKQPRSLTEALELEVDRDIEQLVNMKEREELEEIYGVPIINIPVFVSCLQRIASITITVGISLILSASYLRSNISSSISNFTPPSSSTNQYFLVTFPLVVLLNTCLSVMYSPLILPRVGVHVTAYIAFLIGLGTVFAGLALWDALA